MKPTELFPVHFTHHLRDGKFSQLIWPQASHCLQWQAQQIARLEIQKPIASGGNAANCSGLKPPIASGGNAANCLGWKPAIASGDNRPNCFRSISPITFGEEMHHHQGTIWPESSQQQRLGNSANCCGLNPPIASGGNAANCSGLKEIPLPQAATQRIAWAGSQPSPQVTTDRTVSGPFHPSPSGEVQPADLAGSLPLPQAATQQIAAA